MSETVRMKVEADTQQAEANMNDVVEILNKINSNLDESKKGVEELGEETKENTKQVRGLANSFKGVGLAIKAIGIGLVLKAFDALAGVLESNQKFADGLSKVFTTINIVVGKLLESLEPVVDIFTNLGSAIRALVNRDFDKLSEIGDNLVQSFKDLGNNAKDFANNLGDTVTEANKAADALVKLRNEVELSEARAEQLVQIYENEAEILRQVRDDTRLTVRERIKANQDLSAVLQKQFEEELRQRNKRLELAKLELEQNKSSVQAKKAVIEAETALFELQNRITGQRSEQRANEAALEQEATEAQVERIQLRGLQEVQVEERTLAKKKDIREEDVEDTKRSEKLKGMAVLAGVNTISTLIQAFAKDSEQQSERSFKITKAASIAEATVSTYLSAQQAFASQFVPLATVDSPVRGALAAAAAVASGLLRIKKISQQKFPRGGTGGGGAPSAGGGGGASFSNFTQANTPTISSIPTFNNSPIPTGGESGEPIRAFVVENDITTAQNSQKALERRAIL